MSAIAPTSADSSRATLDLTGPVTRKPPSSLVLAVFVLAAVASLTGVLGGPALGDHETLVAQCARNMRVSGDWIVPRFMDIAWTRKPPLPYWMVAGVSYLFPNDAQTGLPVTAAAARLPSALFGLGTILLLWKLASVMFGPRTGLITGLIASSSILFLLYAPNATAEMPLTFCCVWAYLHFWYAVTIPRGFQRGLHMLLFYVALGVGMMVKGPAPVAMVGLPLAVWWYTHGPLRILARSGPGAWQLALLSFARGLWPRTVQAFTRLWLFPGLLLFAAIFLPWIFAVTERVPQARNEWRWQYVMRAKGDYLDSQDRPPWYYLPIVIGMTAPWVFLLAEAVLAPWLKRYARQHKALLYAGLCALVAIGVMSSEPFKKPYYILPAVPGLLLMMGVVADRFYSLRFQPRPILWAAWGLAVVGAGAGIVFGSSTLRHNWPEVSGRLTIVLCVVAALVLLALALHIRGRSWMAMGLIALTTVGAFEVVWCTSGAALDNVGIVEELAHKLDAARVPADARLLWADGRPDSRLEFYFGRKNGYMIRPEEIVSEIQNRKEEKQAMELMALHRAIALLASPEAVYLIWERKNYQRGSSYGNLKGRVVLEVLRGGDGDKDWLVITNQPAA